MEDSHDDVARRQHVLRRLQIASLLCSTFLVVEVIGGWLSGSLAILSDAAHLFADLAAFCVAIGASYLASLPSTAQHTFGLKRTESLAALFSMVSLALVSVGLAWEALRRLWPMLVQSDNTKITAVDGKLMSGVAIIGVIVNVALAFVLGEHHVHMPGGGGHDHSHDHHNEDGHEVNDNGHSHGHSHGHQENHSHDDHHHAPDVETNSLISTHDHDCSKYGTGHHHELIQHSDEILPPLPKEKKKKNINLHAAYIHVLGDLAQSVAVLIAGIVIWVKPTWHMVDPICTLIFCAVVFYSTLGVLRSSISVLLEEVPPHVDWKEVHVALDGVEGVLNVHDLHIWSISHGIPILSVHAHTVNEKDPGEAVKEMYEVCKSFGIRHATIQVQPANMGSICVTCCPSHADICH